MTKEYLFTSESVSEGHPDKICDQISDTILDLYLSKDPMSRVAAEAMVTPNKIIIGGEITGPESITKEMIDQATRQCVKNIGYEQEQFHWEKIQIENLLIRQSPDIAMGVNSSNDKDEGAGDQGIMFGYACNETEHQMPAPIFFAHRILKNIFKAIHKGEIENLGPDAKSQVTLLYRDNKPVKATSVVVSIQHKSHLSQKQVKEIIKPYVTAAFPDESWMCGDDEFYVNPTGKFIIGGPESDSGLTGRKIIVDTYGGAAPHGGGAFSGKDPSKVDRSAAYAARYLAKNVVAAGLADKCLIQLSYAIGVSKPLSFYLTTKSTGKVADEKIAKFLQEKIDLSPKGIRKHLGLNQPIYKTTATYGHFGHAAKKDGRFSWEKLDLTYDLENEFL